MENKDCSFFHKPWEATVGRSPTTVWFYPAVAIGYTPAARSNNDLPERQWLKESICDTRRSRSKPEREVMGEKRGQKKQVSAGNKRRERGEEKAPYYREKKRGGVESPTRHSQSSSWESPALGGTPGHHHLISVLHQDRLRSKCW